MAIPLKEFSMDAFKTLKSRQEAEIIVKKSRFIGIAFPCDSVELFEKEVERIQNKYSGARHYCYGYRLIEENIINERYQDDKEPSGTAGLPILEVIRHHDLLQCAVVVVRYFGGTLLGTGGLSRAYSDAARDAINASEVIRQIEALECEIVADYHFSGKLEYFLNSENIPIVDTDYTNHVVYTVVIKKEQYDLLDHQVKNIGSNQIEFYTRRDVSGYFEGKDFIEQ
jgi:uncharacterized YigZ family protein